ncbi:MAG: protein kinase domain-containing protein [Planctomycetota bacterium]
MPDPSQSQENQSPENRTEVLETLLARALELQERGDATAVDRLLEEHPDEAPTLRAALDDLARADLLDRKDATLPRRFDDFELLGELGAGGMGVVYRARQTSLEREVALKVIRPELLLFEGSRERFRREIDAVARLDHPAIIQVHATGCVGGVPYYVMPRLRGGSAQDVIVALRDQDRDGLSGAQLRRVLGDQRGSGTEVDDTFDGCWWQCVVRLIRKAALGIQHAHVRGVLHRDLKPSNIYFTPSGQAVVLDFGLARAGGDPHLTRTGSAAGSPAYMAPEQVRGEHADERTDVYGLAATLHALLARRTPFATDTEEVLRSRILAGDRDALREHCDVPAELDVVIATAMDRDRQHRYATCERFAEDLQRVLDGRPITARRLPLRVRARRFVQRHRTVSVASAVALSFVILVPLLLYWQQLRASAVLQDQVEATNTANGKLAAANQELERTNGELQTSNALLSEVNLELKEQIERADKSVSVSIAAVSNLLAGTSVNRLRKRTAPQEVVAGLLRNAYELFGELEFDDKFQGQVLETRLHALRSLCDVLMSMGKLDETEAALAEMEVLLGDGELPSKLLPFRATLHGTRAMIKMDRRDHEGVPELLAKARATYELLLDDEARRGAAISEIASIDNMVAGLAMRSGRMDEAEAALRRAIATTEKLPEQQRIGSTHGVNRLNLVRFLKSNRRYDEALAEIEVQLRELQQLPPDSDLMAWPIPRYQRAMGQNERFRLLQLTQQDDQAIAAAAVAKASLDALIDDFPDSPELPRLRGSLLCNLAIVHGGLEQWQLAVAAARQSVADELEALRMMPDDLQAQRFVATHQRYLCYALRHSERWDELAQEATRLGARRIPALWRVGAARDLLRVVQNGAPSDPAALRERAIAWLQQANAEGRKIDKADELYNPIRNDPRFTGLNQ